MDIHLPFTCFFVFVVLALKGFIAFGFERISELLALKGFNHFLGLRMLARWLDGKVLMLRVC